MSPELRKVAPKDCGFGPNVRQSYDPEELRLLGVSMAQRQINPIILNSDLVIIDGFKRVKAALGAEIAELLAVITDETLSESETTRIQLVSAFHRSDPLPFEKFQAMLSLRAGYPEWSNKQLADFLAIDNKMVKILLSPSECIEAVLEALRAGQIGLSVCHELSLLGPEQQRELLHLKLSGASRDEIARRGRKERNGTAPAERVKRSKFARPSGNLVTLSGPELSLEEAAAELSELATEMRKAAKEGTSIKTFAANCRDRAEAGA